MTINKEKKMEYIEYILLEVGKGTIESGDSVLIDIALIFIEDLKDTSKEKGDP